MAQGAAAFKGLQPNSLRNGTGNFCSHKWKFFRDNREFNRASKSAELLSDGRSTALDVNSWHFCDIARSVDFSPSAEERSVHFPEVRPVNRSGRRIRRRIARTFRDSSPCRNRQKRRGRKNRCEDKCELMLVRCHLFPPGSDDPGPLLQGHRLDICGAHHTLVV